MVLTFVAQVLRVPGVSIFLPSSRTASIGYPTPGYLVAYGGFAVLVLGDGDPPRHGTRRVEVLRRLVEDEVAVPITPSRRHQGEVGDDGILEHVGPSAVLADLLRR